MCSFLKGFLSRACPRPLSGNDKTTVLLQERKFMGYTIGPVLIGFITDKTDLYSSFSILGFSGLVIAILLLVITPRKLKMPISELNKLDGKV